MKIANIVPMKNVERTFEGHFAMTLAHLYKYYPYNNNQLCYVIMDNSMIELGDAVNIETVLHAADHALCHVDEIVLPDKFNDCRGTLERVNRSIEYLYTTGRINDYNLMAVCHGSTNSDFIECFHALNNIKEITCIGIPKVKKERELYEYLWRDAKCHKQIHLLGITESFGELLKFLDPLRIRSVDSCAIAMLSKTGTNVYAKRTGLGLDLEKDEINVTNYDYMIKRLRETSWI